uniref:Uncharacterized protein n=1 Tax=Candidozyma auris TaxID=498019 RepID=A0A0L0NR16_CANAR
MLQRKITKVLKRLPGVGWRTKYEGLKFQLRFEGRKRKLDILEAADWTLPNFTSWHLIIRGN